MENAGRSVKSKLGLLRLADKLGSVTRACEALGYSRDSYYRFRTLYERGGVQALADLSRRKPVLKNRVAGEVEAAVLKASLEHPGYGQQRIAGLLVAAGFRISPSGVRSVWMRHGMETAEKRLFAVLEQTRESGRTLNTEQQAVLDRARQRGGVRPRGFVTRPGEVCYHDVVFMGDHPQCGGLYLMCFVDAYSQFAFATIEAEAPGESAACLFLRDEVLPWFEGHDIVIGKVRTDRRPPFSGRGRRGYPGFLKALEIPHRYRLSRGTTRIDAGRAFVEEVRREVFEPFFRGTDGSFPKLREELARWVTDHNEQRPRPGPSCFGRTPAATIAAALK